MQTYTLDLETLLFLLEEGGQSGFLSTELPSGIPGFKERCRAELNLQEGKLVSCQIKGKNGNALAQGRQALQLLIRLGPTEWQLVEAPPVEATPPFAPPPVSMSPSNRALPSTFSALPQRSAYIDRQLLERLSRRQRQVLNLVDGRRSVEKIASLLSPTLDSQVIQQVMQVLVELEAMGIITIQ